MPAPSPTIRLFVSSTFSDLKAERDALQREVFPRLKQLCLSKGLRFQAIDLRWGVSEEATRDNRTMRICLRELRRCQQDRPKPNFLILLGDRYGWRPLPEIIPATLFEKLAKQLRSTHPAVAQLLQQSYRLDENAVPSVAELQPRGDDKSWSDQVEKPLLSALEQAAQALGLDLNKEGVAIGASATEQEIIEGALKVPDAATHVRAFFRTIDGLPDPAPEYCAETGEAARRLKKLKDRIGKHIGADSVCEYRVPRCAEITPLEKEPESDVASDGRIPHPPKPIGIQTKDLKEFCEKVWKQLSEVVEQQIAALAKVPPEELEERAHLEFGKERCRRFVGRGEPLERITAYLRQGSDKPLAVIGPSGSGKSAIMARAAQAAGKKKSITQIIARYIGTPIRGPKPAFVLARYIGATPGSSDLIQLLRNLVVEIRRRYPLSVATEDSATPSERGDASGGGGKADISGAEVPFEFNPLVNAFHEALRRPTAEQPLWIFLDALDQLTASHNAHSLAWLPATLSEHVRLVVSAALPNVAEAGGADSGTLAVGDRNSTDPRKEVMAALTARLHAGQRVLLAPLTVADGKRMLTDWLADAHRTLQPAQSQAILETFRVEGSPLWLRAAAEEAARLRSWQAPQSFGPTTPGLLGQVLDRLSREEEHGEMLVSRTLSYLACARHGLAEDEILDILSADSKVMDDFRRRSPDSPKTDSLPVAVWVRLHGDLAFYLAEHRVQEASLLWFYHRSFLEAVTAHCLAAGDDRRARHQQLADWFGKQAWFLAPAKEETKPKEGAITDPPNARKASELPWHLYRAADAADPDRCQEAMWQPLAEALCDILLVEAKVRSEQVFELQEDYRYALDGLPEDQARLHEEKERKTCIQRWTAGLIAYAQAHGASRDQRARGGPLSGLEPELPSVVPSCRIWTEEEVNAECSRIAEHPRRSDRLLAFASFVLSQSHTLMTYGQRPGFVLQHAVNREPAGPVHNAAELVLPALQAPRLWRCWPAEVRPNPMPPLLRTLESHNETIGCASVTPDGRRAVSTSWDQTLLRVWDLESGQCLRTLKGHIRSVFSVSVTPDGRRAVSGSFDNTLRVWDLESGECLRTLKGHTSTVKSVSVTPDGRRAVSGSSDNTLRVWDLESGECLRTLNGHTNSVTDVSVTPDGRCAISASHDCTLRAWDLESGLCQRTLVDHTSWVECVSVTPDGRRAVSGSLDDTLRVWDLENGQCLRTLGGSGGVLCVSMTPDGRRAVSASGSGTEDGTLRVWDLESGLCLRILDRYHGTISSVSVMPDGRRAVSASGRLKIWNLESGLCLQTSAGHNGGVAYVGVTPNGRRAVSGGEDNRLRVWDAESGLCRHVLIGHTRLVEYVAVTADGRRAVSGSADNTLRVWDLESGQCLRTLEGHTNTVFRVRVMPDGRSAVSVSCDRTLRVWDLESGQCLRTFEGLTGTIYSSSVSVTPDGRRAVSGSGDGTLWLWNLESGSCLRTLEGCNGEVWSVSVTPDGRRAVSGSTDRMIRVWDMESRQCLRTLAGHTRRIEYVSVTSDGRRAVSRSADDTLRVWDMESGRCLWTLPGGSSHWPNSMDVTPDGRHAASVWNGLTLRVWDLERGTCAALYLASAPIRSVAISPSAASVVCGTTMGEVVILELSGIEFGPPV